MDSPGPSLRLVRNQTVLGLALLTGSALGQVTATYTPYGAGCSGTGTGLGANHVLPAANANAFGGSDNSIPFTWSPVRYQQLFAGADLPAALVMAGLSLRQNERGPVAHGVTVDLEIHVGYTTRTPTTMSSSFASNFDAGAPVTVLPRTLVVFPDQPNPPTNPTDFFFTIPWPATFSWNAATDRHFLVEVLVFGNSNGNQPWGYPLDATGGATARLYGSPPTATTGTLERNYGLVLGIRALTHTATPILFSTSTPQINDTFRVRVAQARPAAPALLCLGTSRTAWGSIPLPFDLGAIGAPGCLLLTSVLDSRPVTTSAAGEASFSYGLPNDIYMLGLPFYNQWLVADPTVNALGFVLSNGGAGVIGNQ